MAKHKEKREYNKKKIGKGVFLVTITVGGLVVGVYIISKAMGFYQKLRNGVSNIFSGITGAISAPFQMLTSLGQGASGLIKNVMDIPNQLGNAKTGFMAMISNNPFKSDLMKQWTTGSSGLMHLVSRGSLSSGSKALAKSYESSTKQLSRITKTVSNPISRVTRSASRSTSKALKKLSKLNPFG